jgi:endopolyphosphatase
VFEYNTSGLPDYVNDAEEAALPGDSDFEEVPMFENKDSTGLDGFYEDIQADITTFGEPEHEFKHKRHHFKVPKKPSKATAPGPAYSPQSLSLISYKQYFANLTHINNDFANAVDDEFDDDDDVNDERWKPGKHHGKTKKGKPHPRKFEFEVEYDTADNDVYGLKDLTVRSYIALAKAISKTEGHDANDSWHTFVQRAFVGAIDREDLEREFGSWSKHNTTNREGGNTALEL